MVHLVRKVNGLGPLERFVASYRRHPAGAEHQLVLLFKGFRSERDREPYLAVSNDLRPRVLDLPDDGFDLGAYHRAALALPHRVMVFLNSFSLIRVDGWLGHLTAAHEPGVGLVGASGSWGSRSSHARYGVGLGGPYAQIFDDPHATHQVFVDLTKGDEGESPREVAPNGRLKVGLSVARQVASFAGFPSPHLRTNGFLVERDLWLRVCRRVPRDKAAAYRMESGRLGLTAKVRRMGMRVLVVGSDGRAYEPADWPRSNTFWQSDQENLLIADNQTLSYEQGTMSTRSVLSRYAWGRLAEPSQPRAAEAR